MRARRRRAERSSTSRPGAITASTRRCSRPGRPYVGGAAGTSLVEAGRRYGIPLSGTMAHSYVMAHDRERDAFAAFLRQYGATAVLLIDTYDTVQGAHEAVAAMAADGHRGQRRAPRLG